MLRKINLYKTIFICFVLIYKCIINLCQINKTNIIIVIKYIKNAFKLKHKNK